MISYLTRYLLVSDCRLIYFPSTIYDVNTDRFDAYGANE